MSLGTPHYMSPEQAMGEREITPKADIYALGCVLYEMLTGEPPFPGASAQAIIARVLTEEPRSLTVQRDTIPPNVEAAVRMALAKLPADRFASARAFGEALARSDFAMAGTQAFPVGTTTAGPVSPRQRLLRVAPWVLAAAGVSAAAWFATQRPVLVPPPVAQFAVTLTPEVATNQNGQVMAISPDGSRIVYVSTANAQLYTRLLGQVEPVPIPGTGGALSPFFSPDGEFVAFVVGSRLVKLAVRGGPALPIADVSGTFFGGTWNEQDEILFATEAGLHLVPAAGGVPTLLVGPDSGSGESFRWPEFLPGGKTALLAIWDGSVDHLGAVTLGSGALQRLDLAGSNPHYIRQGYLVFAMIRLRRGRQQWCDCLGDPPHRAVRPGPTGHPRPRGARHRQHPGRDQQPDRETRHLARGDDRLCGRHRRPLDRGVGQSGWHCPRARHRRAVLPGPAPFP